MKDRKQWLVSFCLVLLLASSFSVQARIYKWYDESGKVYYSQSPPPKGAKSAPINTDTFSTMEMRKVPKLSSTVTKTVRPKRIAKPKLKTISKKRTTRSSCPLRR